MKESAVTECVARVLGQCGLELDRIEFFRAGKQQIVRVSVDGDGPEGSGPTLDEIAAATKEVSRALDDLSATGDRSYVLEVSSRGVSRPLTQAKHYRRNRGRLVRIVVGEDSIEGRIVDCADGKVRLTVADQDVEIALGDIESAVVQVELR